MPVYGADGGYDERVSGYALVKPLSESQAREARRRLHDMLEPGAPAHAAAALARLRSLTKAKDSLGVATAYLGEIVGYPEWAIDRACHAFASSEVFFPAWSELRAKLESLVEPHRKMLEALDAAPPEMGGQGPTPAPKYNQLSPEQRAEFDKTMADFYRETGRSA